MEKFLFYLFIFLLPFQVGKFLFSFSSLSAQAVSPDFFYHQFFIYLSDIMIVALLCLWTIRIIRDNQKRIVYKNIKKDIFLVLFIIISGISILVAGNKILAVLHFIKLSEFILLYFYIKNNFRLFDTRLFSYVALSSALLQVVIASFQFYFQESLGIRHVGESVISPVIQNVAKINEGGFKLLRAYGTFPHPNILAAFLSFALFLPYYLYMSHEAKIRQESVIDHLPYYLKMRQMASNFRYPVYGLVFFALIIGLFLTFSRIAIAFFALIILMIIILTIKKNIEFKKIYRLLFLIILTFLFCIFAFNKELFSRFSEIDSVAQRIFYLDIFKNAIAHSPIIGIGIGNFVDYFYSNFPNLQIWQYQPVHNLFLMIITETGIVGGALFMLFLGQNIVGFIKSSVKDLFGHVILSVVAVFLIFANFDHYFWTLQQGQILFWTAMGLLGAFNIINNENNILSSKS